LKNKGIEELVNAVEGIVAGNCVGQLKVLAEPLFFGISEFFHVIEAFAATDDGTEGDEKDIGKMMFTGPLEPWIVHSLKDEDDGGKRSGVGLVRFLRCGHPRMIGM
jgi:hypothetical protein